MRFSALLASKLAISPWWGLLFWGHHTWHVDMALLGDDSLTHRRHQCRVTFVISRALDGRKDMHLAVFLFRPVHLLREATMLLADPVELRVFHLSLIDCFPLLVRFLLSIWFRT